jgi:hypothetical protein
LTEIEPLVVREGVNYDCLVVRVPLLSLVEGRVRTFETWEELKEV